MNHVQNLQSSGKKPFELSTFAEAFVEDNQNREMFKVKNREGKQLNLVDVVDIIINYGAVCLGTKNGSISQSTDMGHGDNLSQYAKKRATVELELLGIQNYDVRQILSSVETAIDGHIAATQQKGGRS